MTAFVVDVSSADRGIVRVGNLTDLIAAPIREAMREVADNVRLDAASTIQRRGPSRPGQPPSRVTGQLLASLKTKMPRPRKGGERAYVIGAARYAFMLESGSRRYGKRPFLVPAARRHTQEFITRIEQAIALAIRQSTA